METTISSVSELISLFNSATKDQTILLDGVRKVLIKYPPEGLSGPLPNYLRSEPKMPHFYKLLAMVMQSNDHDFMAGVFLLMRATLKTLSKMEMQRAALEDAVKTILSENMRAFYRLLSSGNPLCMTLAIAVVKEIASLGMPGLVSLLLASFDWTHAGLQKASFMRKSIDKKFIPIINTASPSPSHLSPRNAYIQLVIALIDYCSGEERLMIAQTNTFLLQYALDGVDKDDLSIITPLLHTIQSRIVLNEEGNRNMAVAVLRKHFTGSLAALLDSKNEAIALLARDFYLEIAGKPSQGIAYPVDSTTRGHLKNKLIFDLIQDFNLINDQSHLDLALALFKAAPDVAWMYLATGRGMHLEPSDSASFISSVTMAIKLFSIIADSSLYPSDSKGDVMNLECLLPKSITKTNLSKGILNSNGIIRLYSLLLMLAALKSLPSWILTDKKTLVGRLSDHIPDGKTLYNSWKMATSRMEDGEADIGNEMLECSHLMLLSYYLDMDPSLGDMIKLGDFSNIKNDAGEELKEALHNLLRKLDPIRLLKSKEDVAALKRLIIMKSDSRRDLVEALLKYLSLASVANARVISLQSEDILSEVIQAIYDIYTIPMIFKGDDDPIVSWFNHKGIVLQTVNVVENEEIEASGAANGDQQEVPTSSKTAINVHEVIPFIDQTSNWSFVSSIIAHTKRSQIVGSYTLMNDESGNLDLSLGLPDLLTKLLVDYDHRYWLSMLSCLFSSDSAAQEVDLRMLVESGVLGYAIIGLSLSDMNLRKASHLILNRYHVMLQQSRLRDRNQISMVLTALSGNFIPPTPFATILPRLDAFFYAHALMVILRPEHALYRPIYEIFLACQTPNAFDFFSRLFFDANADVWQKQCQWCLHVIDEAMSQSCNIDELHLIENVAMFIQSPVDNALRKTCMSILRKASLERAASYPWLPLLLDSIDSKSK